MAVKSVFSYLRTPSGTRCASVALSRSRVVRVQDGDSLIVHPLNSGPVKHRSACDSAQLMHRSETSAMAGRPGTTLTAWLKTGPTFFSSPLIRTGTDAWSVSSIIGLLEEVVP